MLPLEEYLERRGAKYFITLLMMFYVMGTIIFNIYLRSIGLYEFDLLQLRYMFIGFTFGLITFIVPAFLLVIKHLVWGKGEDWTKKEKKERERVQNRIEKIVLVLAIPWVMVYALYIFPQISPGFGGAKPVEARLIGEANRIKRINSVIARETGVDIKTLPYEELDDSDLAVGANVQILDQSKDRYLLLLTKDLYLSSQSSVAKKLIEGGSSQDIDIADTENFQNKPLPISSEGIETITLSLYEPPNILTKTDLEVAASTLAMAPNSSSDKVVSDILKSVDPERAEQAFAAVKNTATEVKKTLPATGNTGFVVSSATEIETALETQYDTTWLDVRSDLFNASSRLQGIEKAGINEAERNTFIAQIKSLLEEYFFGQYDDLDFSETGYLAVGGQYDPGFALNLTRALRGAQDVGDFISRVNALSFDAPVVLSFEDVKTEVLTYFDEAVLTQDTSTTRNFISEKIFQYLGAHASGAEDSWKAPGYLSAGVVQEGFSQNLKTAFETATTWDELKVQLETLHAALHSMEETAPEPETRETTGSDTTPTEPETTQTTESSSTPEETSETPTTEESSASETTSAEEPVIEASTENAPEENSSETVEEESTEPVVPEEENNTDASVE